MQKISEVCLQRYTLQISDVWALTCPKRLQQVCISSSECDVSSQPLGANFLLCAPSREESERDTQTLLGTFYNLAYTVTQRVFSLPLKSIESLDLEIDSVSFQKICQPLVLFHWGNLISLIAWLHLTGLMFSHFCHSSGTAGNKGYPTLGVLVASGLTQHLSCMIGISPWDVAWLTIIRDPHLYQWTHASLIERGAVLERRSINRT